MRFKASIIPPGYPPNNSSHTWFGNTASVILPNTLFTGISIVNQQSIRTVRHLTDKHTRRTCGTDSGMSAITIYRDIISRHIGTIDNGSSFTHTCKFHTSHPWISQSNHVQWLVCTIVLPSAMMFEIIFCLSHKRQILHSHFFIMRIPMNLPFPTCFHFMHNRLFKSNTITTFSYNLMEILYLHPLLYYISHRCLRLIWRQFFIYQFRSIIL